MKTKILLLAANPKNTSSLRLSEEFREINESLALSKTRDKFAIEQGGALRVKDFHRLAINYEPNIIHFSGHGSEEGIFLENDNGEIQLASGQALASFFGLLSDIECVILNACYSKTQAELISKEVPYVIGMNNPITDIHAIKFSRVFYDALGASKTIEKAYEFGCSAIEFGIKNNRKVDKRSLKLPNKTKESIENKPVLLINDNLIKNKESILTTSSRFKKWFSQYDSTIQGVIISSFVAVIIAIFTTLFTFFGNKDKSSIHIEETDTNGGAIILGNNNQVNTDSKRQQFFTIAVSSNSGRNIRNVKFFQDDSCTKEIGSTYNPDNNKYRINRNMKREEQKEISAISENYDCKPFILDQTRSTIPVKLNFINCENIPNHPECLYR